MELPRTLGAPRRLTAVLLAGTLLMLLGWVACGGGGGTMSFNSGSGTPAGTYALTVTGTYTNSPGSTLSSLTNSTTVTLHVN
jgi:hypothetical protein